MKPKKTFKIVKEVNGSWRTMFQNESEIKALTYYEHEISLRPGVRVILLNPYGKPIKQSFPIGS